jgi:RNA polymerase sigma factor (sigma-70 family)
MTNVVLGRAESAAGVMDADSGCDVAELYRDLSRPLERIVRAEIHAPDALIEEACQFAWARLVHHRATVRRKTALAWLARTAMREAIRLSGRGRRELSLDAELDELADIATRDPEPALVCEQREQLCAVGTLPLRQQRLLWLHALGLSYEEIAVRDGCTSRTVERQLQQGRAALRAAASR